MSAACAQTGWVKNLPHLDRTGILDVFELDLDPENGGLQEQVIFPGLGEGSSGSDQREEEECQAQQTNREH